MNSIILTGVITVQLALICYTVFIINEHKNKRAAKTVLYSLTIAVIFDMIATGCMMAGTEKTYFTLHGSIGYSALFLMIIDAVLIWKHKITKGAEVAFSKWLNIFSKVAYVWWLVAFLNGVSNVV